MIFKKFNIKINYLFFLLLSLFFLFSSFNLFNNVFAASFKVVGKAKVLNTNSFFDFTNFNSNVFLNISAGEFEGYVFSEDLGWIAFGRLDNDIGPVLYDKNTGIVSGKAKVLGTGGYLDFTNFNSNVLFDINTNNFSGYVWSTDLGWIDFETQEITLQNFADDIIEPTINASNIKMYDREGGLLIENSSWTNSATPYIEWEPAADNLGGSGIKGYCLYLGTDSNADPGNSSNGTGSAGILKNSPVSTFGTDCMFITSNTYLDFSAGSYLASNFISGQTYYFKIKAIDFNLNTFNQESETFIFNFDSQAPNNTTYISCSSSSFTSVSEMVFNWPISGSISASDLHSGILGVQYQLNSNSGNWVGTDSFREIKYIPYESSVRYLSDELDGDFINTGSNIVYMRVVDRAGNFSDTRTCTLNFGGLAPNFPEGSIVGVSPEESEVNLYSFSWPAAIPAVGKSIKEYYYMVNTPLPLNINTLRSNTQTFRKVDLNTSVYQISLQNLNKGSNTINIAVVDNDDNYSPLNGISGNFILNSNNPDNVTNLVASDSSIKSQSKWYATLTWVETSYQGAGNLTYEVFRSENNSNFSFVGSTSGSSFVDNVPDSRKYFYQVYVKDGASALSTGTNSVEVFPTGRYTEAAKLNGKPSISNITTRKATITWNTNRLSDSKVQYGKKKGSYFDEEPSNSTQKQSHEIILSGLEPGTNYYFKTKWTDEDGNTGISTEFSFKTQDAPSVSNVLLSNVSLNQATINFTVNNNSKVKIYYGPTSSFGNIKELNTSLSEGNYSIVLDNLIDGTDYYYKINKYDAEGAEYEGDVYTFKTLPRPQITNITLQNIANSIENTILVSWESNTEVTSVITYYPDGSPEEAKDQVKLQLEVGKRTMLLTGLKPKTRYILQVKGRDILGNEALSNLQRFTSSSDSRPPVISNLKITGNSTSSGSDGTRVQLIVSWDTDEPSTSQVIYGQGTGTNYPQKTQEDDKLKTNHSVVISNLTSSQVYHLRAVSKDSAGNEVRSFDTVTLAPRAIKSAFDLVFDSLYQVFSVGRR
jgi:hypothetical protein